MSTLLLDLTNWDLLTDADGNIAVASEPYALAQDVASAIKLFAAELRYDTTQGIPYFEKILGQTPPLSLLKEYFVNQALTVPGVVSAQCLIQTFDGRTIAGQVQFTDINGNTSNVQF